MKGESNFGYLESVETGRLIYPDNCKILATEGDDLVFHDGQTRAALFAYDSHNQAIMHISRKYWNPQSGRSYPHEGDIVHLWDGIHDVSHFKFVDASGKEVNPYPTPHLLGNWKMINSILNPDVNHTYTFSYTTGKSQTQSSTSQHAWSVSAEVSSDWFSASGDYSGYVEKTSQDTFYEEKTVERSIIVKPGQSVVTWQWALGAVQNGDILHFKSNILTDTNSLEEPAIPSLPKKDEKIMVCVNM